MMFQCILLFFVQLDKDAGSVTNHYFTFEQIAF